MKEKWSPPPPPPLVETSDLRRFTLGERLANAVKIDDVEAMESALADGADMEWSNPFNRGATALLAAAYAGSRQCVSKLIELGADHTATTANNWNALMCAVKGKSGMCARLLAKDGKPESRAKGAGSPIASAGASGSLGVLRAVAPHCRSLSRALMAAAGSDWASGVAFILEKEHSGKPRCSRAAMGKALVNAAQARSSECLAALLARADAGELLVKNGLGLALSECAMRGEAGLCRQLISAGADATWADKKGRTPLHEAAARGHVDAVRVLLPHSQCEALTAAGKTASQEALENCEPQVLEAIEQYMLAQRERSELAAHLATGSAKTGKPSRM